jgi:HTH-type transcriptional regulator / antitoxin HigA
MSRAAYHPAAVGDDYMKLVRAFPLRPIRTVAEHEAAGRILNRLMGRPGGQLTAGERDYLEALARFAEDYDQHRSRMVPASRTPLDALKYLMEQSAMRTGDLGRVLGTTHAAASLILHGKRGISGPNAKILAEYFKVDAGAFL